MIQISNLYKSFRDKHILSGVNLDIETGKITTIIGRSGCGKSVLLKHIVALLRPDKGKVIVEGENLSNMSSSELFETRKKMG
ncbi:ATP-binding cassette domain-containing protein, partial [bacterium]|nr:ATP-binding cassette domain-containing protein [bacterium]